ncbi:hypothetical protein AUEXF2481DRAFT_25807 [Aureobasidium subglaciale EXF-2481]|uniref:FAD/NAD(P)-binding domain-containing protein n=1 Tax=Aureobasidium subglaciale (strain EXF-2481) TaxID=1043005 RepID=A0A074ZNJ7_AURSE|nr:uncharacterized protein AUEXF2481DRAFT_25807 [Aureobasidium subglaciale EXF-2481]KEQ99931.1 hypothetical protein AUEXF2481DRAFT_25807 [Aureobasidium subglaciale EXF-2481]
MRDHALPTVIVSLSDPVSLDATGEARAVLQRFNAAVAADRPDLLEECFYAEQSFWKDQLALTWHLRTIISPAKIASALLETKNLRSVTGNFELDGSADFVQAGPTMVFVTCAFSFGTESPAANCSGRMWLLPVMTTNSQTTQETLNWKIWILSTKLDHLDEYPEDRSVLQTPGTSQTDSSTFKTDVFIVGGGNAAAALSARLKALGVHSVMADRNAQVGDNWTLRYDALKFHVRTSLCGPPYLEYPEELQDQLLTKKDLAAHLSQYVRAFNLNIINSVEIIETTRERSGEWHVRFRIPNGTYTAIAKHVVQATGIGSQIPYAPAIEEPQAYTGISIHSSQFKNASKLKEEGVKTVCIVGSANTAFDVLEDCHAAGLQTTMIARSPTYMVPLTYICNKIGLGAYDNGVEAADNLFMMLPSIVDSQFAQGLFAALASQEPDRYSALRKVGFQVIDSQDLDAALVHNLLERGGGHYVDTGATELIVSGEASFRAGVEPKAYTSTGLLLSDGSSLDADAVIWCTGFADKDARETVADILKISLPIDATWGVDTEGEIRGMWKRHSQVENYWIMGGFTQQHRWHSATLAHQIKASLEGLLPPPYIS